MLHLLKFKVQSFFILDFWINWAMSLTMNNKKNLVVVQKFTHAVSGKGREGRLPKFVLK